MVVGQVFGVGEHLLDRCRQLRIPVEVADAVLLALEQPRVASPGNHRFTEVKTAEATPTSQWAFCLVPASCPTGFRNDLK
jgi:hypothetical protein